MTSLKSQAMNAMKWSYLSFAGLAALQLVFSAVLARLLSPKEFGVVALAGTLQGFGAYLANMGVGPALVQKRELTGEDVRAAFTASVALGALTTLIAWALAPLAGKFFGDPAVVAVFRGFASTYIPSTLIIVSTSLLRRQLRFKPITVAEVGAYLTGQGVVGVGAAYLGYGAFSLVYAAITQSVIQLALTYPFARHSLKFSVRWSAYRELYAFGSRASLISFLEFISQNLDIFMIGRLYGPAPLGLYSRAYNAVAAPLGKFALSFVRVLVPSFSQVQQDQARLRRAYLSGLMTLSVVIFGVAFGVFAAAPEIVRVMLGTRYEAAIPIMRVFALFIPFPLLTNLSAAAAEATARLNVKILIQGTYLLVLALAFWLVHALGFGVIGFAAVLLFVGVARTAAYSLVAERIIGQARREIGRAYAFGIASGLLVGGVIFAAARPLRTLNMSSFFILPVEMLLGALVLGAIIVLGPPTELQGALRRMLGRFSKRAAAG